MAGTNGVAVAGHRHNGSVRDYQGVGSSPQILKGDEFAYYAKHGTLDGYDPAPPHNRRAEVGLIGSVMLDPSHIAKAQQQTGINCGHFYDPLLGRLFVEVVAMHHGGLDPSDVHLLAARLEAAGELSAIGVGTITECVEAAPIATHALEYAREIVKRAKLRHFAYVLQDAHAKLLRGEKIGYITADVHNAVEEVLDDEQRTGFKPRSMAELVAGDFAVEYEIDGMLVSKQPCAILGQSKAMKTTIALDLAISLATGGNFLGRFRCKHARRVYVLSGESGLGTIRETLMRQAAAAFRDLAEVENLFVDDTLPQLTDAVHLEALRDVLVRLRTEVLIIDPLYLCLDAGGREGSLYAMGAALARISQLAQSLGITLILLHHLKETTLNPYKPGRLQDSSWSGIQQFARQWIVITRRQEYESGTGVHRLWVNGGGSAGHSFVHGVNVDEGLSPNRHWFVEVNEPGDIREAEADRSSELRQQAAQERLDADLRALFDVLAKFPAGETKSTLSTHTGFSGGKVGSLVAEALRREAIEPCQITKNRRTEAAFKLRSDAV